jgi:hypothetical protein
MSFDEALSQLAHECPRKIMSLLHAKGVYRHGTSARFPGKVLCFHENTAIPVDWVPTPAQKTVNERAPKTVPAAATEAV